MQKEISRKREISREKNNKIEAIARPGHREDAGDGSPHQT